MLQRTPRKEVRADVLRPSGPSPEQQPAKRATCLALTTGLILFALMLFACILMLVLYVSQAHAEMLPVACASCNPAFPAPVELGGNAVHPRPILQSPGVRNMHH